LGIAEEDSTLDMSLALEMAEFYQIKQVDAKRIIDNTKSIVADNWHVLAKKYGLSRTAIERMSPAFMGQ
jgi:serine/threonine-protein kinase HipA